MSGLPAGFRPVPEALPKGFAPAPDAPLPNGFRDAPAAIDTLDTQIDSAASSNGIDPHVFRSLISHESSFNPRAVSSAGAQGLGQLMPGTAKEMGVADAFDPQQNLNGSAKYLGSLVKRYHGDYDRALAAYNAGPGNVDKMGLNALRVPGADPTYVSKIMGSLNAPIVAPAEAASTATALPQGFRAVDDATATPGIKPPALKPQRQSTQAPPTPSHVERTPIEQIGGALTAATQSLPGAIAENRLSDFIGMVKKGDFAGAKDEFGFLSKPMLERGAKSGNPFARYALDHPAGTAAAQFAADWFDPALNLAGKGIAKAAGEGAKLIAATPEGRLLLNAFSPFKSIAAGAGDAGKRAMQSMMVRLASKPAEAQKAALQIFGGLSDAEQHDVVHIHQDKPSYIQTTDPKRLATLKGRATTLSRYVTDLSDAQVGAGRLQATTAAARDKYFPLSDYFTPIRTDAQKAKFIEDLTPSSGSGSLSRATSEAKPAEHTSLAQAEHRVANDINFHATKNPDWSPVQALEDWGTRRSKNIEFDESLKGMPNELRRDMTPADYRLPNGQPMTAWKSSAYETDAETLAKMQRDHPDLARESPMDLRGRSMLAFDELPHNVQEQLANSPVMKTSWVSQDFAKYLASNATRLFKEPTIETGNKVLDGALKTWDGFNNATRAAIIANPLYHPLFNLSNNTLGAGLPLHQVASLVTKNIVNTFGGGKLIDAFEKRVGQDYSMGLDDAMRAGALAEMKIGGQDATRRLAARWQDLSTGDKIGKFGDTVQAWNSRLTFGKRGEKAFSNALYAHLMKSGKYQPEEAGGLVREALGNYQNVSPQAWQNRVFFFYPWLKGNMAFWARKAATNPKAVYAPADAARRNNQLVADPNERKPAGRAKDFQFTFGNAKDGFGRGTLPLPQRMVTDVDEMTSGDPARVGKSALNVGSSRLVPGLKALYDSAVTIAQPAKDPRLPQNFNTVFDKDAARPRQYQQIGTYAAGMLPVPVVGFEAKDALREGGVKDPRMSAIAALTSTGLHADSRDADYKQINGIRRQLETSLSRTKNIADPDRRAVVVKQAQDVYDRRIARFLPGQSRPRIMPPPIDSLPGGFRTVDAPLPQGFRPVH